MSEDNSPSLGGQQPTTGDEPELSGARRALPFDDSFVFSAPIIYTSPVNPRSHERNFAIDIQMGDDRPARIREMLQAHGWLITAYSVNETVGVGWVRFEGIIPEFDDTTQGFITQLLGLTRGGGVEINESLEWDQLDISRLGGEIDASDEDRPDDFYDEWG